MSLPDNVSKRVTTLLCDYAGTQVRIASSQPITEGWSAQSVTEPWPWVTRCAIEGDSGGRAELGHRQTASPRVPHP